MMPGLIKPIEEPTIQYVVATANVTSKSSPTGVRPIGLLYNVLCNIEWKDNGEDNSIKIMVMGPLPLTAAEGVVREYNRLMRSSLPRIGAPPSAKEGGVGGDSPSKSASPLNKKRKGSE